MKLMTWNIKDGGVLDLNRPDTSNIESILQVVKKEDPDVLVLQEYQGEFFNELISNGLNKLSYLHTVCEEHPDKTLRKRVLIASKAPFQDIDTAINILDYSRRNWREIAVSDNSMHIHILGIHVPLATTNIFDTQKDNRREKRIFLEALKRKFIEYKNSDDPCVICGDFNLHSNAVYKEYLDDFSQLLTEITTNDATHGKYKFDYIFVNDAFRKMINVNGVFAPHMTNCSDHSYLCVETA